jgi:hypothetical protein
MLKPTDEELQVALAEAGRMREQDADPHHLARSLRYLEHRVRLLEAVHQAATDYLRFGQEEHHHAILVNAIEAARDAERQDDGPATDALGL